MSRAGRRWFLLAAGGALTLVPIAAGLALRTRGRPLAARTAWVLLNAFVVVGVLASTLLSSLFFSEALYVVLAAEVIACCLAAGTYTVWRAAGMPPDEAVRRDDRAVSGRYADASDR